MSEIIDRYDRISYDIISQDESVRDYEARLFDTISSIRSLYVNHNIFENLAHSVTIVKGLLEVRRLKQLDREFEGRKSACVLDFCKEDTGNLDFDLRDRANHFKLIDVMKFMDENPINEPELLQKTKKKTRRNH